MNRTIPSIISFIILIQRKYVLINSAKSLFMRVRSRDFARTLLNLKRGNGKEDFSNLCSKLQPVFIDFTFCTTAKGGYRTYLLHPRNNRFRYLSDP